jgi:hypothetical protein
MSVGENRAMRSSSLSCSPMAGLVSANAVAIYDLGLSSIYAKSATHSANASGRETFRTFGVRDG